MSEYIDREAAYPLAKKICDAIDSKEFQRFDFGTRILDWIDDIPAADVRPVKPGKWTKCIVATDNLYDERGMIENMKGYVCDSCREFSIARYNYCPNCGAEMREES